MAHPRVEDVFVALLRFDVLAARALIEQNADGIDLDYLLKRIFQEELEEEAIRTVWEAQSTPNDVNRDETDSRGTALRLGNGDLGRAVLGSRARKGSR